MSMRVASLLASATEIVCALDRRDWLVGRSHECDFPASVTNLPVLTEPKLDMRLPSAAIDARVRALVSEALSVYRVDAAALRALHPDVIVTQMQCEVCAVSERDVACALEEWMGVAPRVVSLRAETLAGFWDDIRAVARALAVDDGGEALIARLQQRMTAVAKRVERGHPEPERTHPEPERAHPERERAHPEREHPEPAHEHPEPVHEHPVVACIEWIEPLMASGNWMPELVAMAGGTNAFGEIGRHSPRLSWEELLARDPDVVIVLPCGFDLERTREEAAALTLHPHWPQLSAVRAGRVFLADGNQYFNRSGPRLVESLEILAEILHPQLFDFGYRGIGWEPFTATQSTP